MLCNARKRTQDTYRERAGGLPRCRALSTQQGGYVRATNLIIIIIIIIIIITLSRLGYTLRRLGYRLRRLDYRLRRLDL